MGEEITARKIVDLSRCESASDQEEPPRQVKFKVKSKPRNNILLARKSADPPKAPRLPGSKAYSDLTPFIAPGHLISPNLDTRSAEFRIAHVRYFNQLCKKYSKLDRVMYFEANKQMTQSLTILL